MRKIICSLFLVFMCSAVAEAQETIFCKQFLGCSHSDTSSGCKVDIHWLLCDGITHGSRYEACTNKTCHDTCSCSCLVNGYGTSWADCDNTIHFFSINCAACATPTPTPTPGGGGG